MDLSLHLSQKQMLSQKMQQSAEILQMSTLSLSEYLQQIAMENPVIEWQEEDKKQEDELDSMRKRMEWLDASDEQNRKYYQQEWGEERDEWNFSSSQGESLIEYLMFQISMLPLDEKQRKMVGYFAQCINNNGYIQEGMIETLAGKFNLTSIEVEQSLELLQSLEPAGIGAGNLTECLLLQLQRKDKKYIICEQIIKNYLEELGKNQLQLIARKLQVKMGEVIEAKKIIQSLNPRPGSGFVSEKYMNYIVADILVYWEAGKLRVELSDGSLPYFKMNPYYQKVLSDSSEIQAKEYIATKVRQAQWVMQCVEKRNTTLLRAVEAIVEWQMPFFIQKEGKLKPMRLLDIAKQLDMHESTISRAVKEKYLQCNKGVFPLSHFFSAGISTEGEVQISSHSVKEKISEVIEKEDKNSPYSDRQITEILEEMGVDISRRTVTKYREAMGIPGASGRKIFQ